MTTRGLVATATTTAGTSGTIITALLTNSTPLLIIGALLGIALLVVSAVVLTAARSKDAERAARAEAVLDRLISLTWHRGRPSGEEPPHPLGGPATAGR